VGPFLVVLLAELIESLLLLSQIGAGWLSRFLFQRTMHAFVPCGVFGVVFDGSIPEVFPRDKREAYVRLRPIEQNRPLVHNNYVVRAEVAVGDGVGNVHVLDPIAQILTPGLHLPQFIAAEHVWRRARLPLHGLFHVFEEWIKLFEHAGHAPVLAAEAEQLVFLADKPFLDLCQDARGQCPGSPVRFNIQLMSVDLLHEPAVPFGFGGDELRKPVGTFFH